MKAALVVHRVQADPAANLQTVVRLAHGAADTGAELALFSETALTGFIADDDPAHDLPLGQPIPGPATDQLAAVAQERRMWLALGLYEREDERLYDAAVLLSPEGDVALKYRRIHPHWHGRRADPSVYRQGTELAKAETPFGSCAFLLCGDIVDDSLIARVRALRPDWLLFPFARHFDTEVADRQQWEREEQFRYAARAKLAGVKMLAVNYLDETGKLGGCFGGAMAVEADGTVRCALPLGQEGILLA